MSGQGSNLGYKLLGMLAFFAFWVSMSAAPAPSMLTLSDYDNEDTVVEDTLRKLRFPIKDKSGNPVEDEQVRTIDLKDPSNISKELRYNSESNQYEFIEKIGDQYYRTPTSMDFDDYLRYRSRQQDQDNFKKRMDALTMFNSKPTLPKMSREGIFDRIFGGTALSVQPQGNVDLTVGYIWNRVNNPSMPINNRKNNVPDFDVNMNLNLMASVGEKIKFNVNMNSKPTFGQENKFKLDYAGKEDEIIKRIEAGNISFPLKSSLITGAQALTGIKTQLQFGKLWVTGAISQQKSKRSSMTVQGGAMTQQFSIKADDYEENRHFLLSQYFRNNYNTALSQYPVYNAPTNITKIEVWVTNRTGATQDVRDVVTFMDLGEVNPYLQTLKDPSKPTNPGFPDNRSNRLYDQLMANPMTRSKQANNSIDAMGLAEPIDYQRTTAKKLTPSEFIYDPRLGYISLISQPNPDDVVGVAFQYTVNGQTYQVGEFATDLPPDSTNQKVLFLKMLKGTSARPGYPIWDLMMKNIYSIGGYGVTNDEFRLNVLYQDPGGGEKRYLPEGENAGKPIISLINLDRLNFNNDPSPDGVFDYIEGVTIRAQQGKIIFPVLEPFGSDLNHAFGTDTALKLKYLYNQLYDSTKTIARQFQQLNRFIIKGSYKGSSSTDIQLNGFNIPQGSVTVSAGGQKLVENVDFQIDYGMGRVKILNQGILTSGIPINIQYEDNGNFGFYQQNFTGLRAEYFFNEKFNVGGTYMRLRESPFTQKVNFGDDPIQNNVYGADINYQSESPFITRMLDKLPIYSTTAPSFITASAEAAALIPGHNKMINGLDPEGSVYIDDFEGTRSSFDLKTPLQNWSLSSVPVGAVDRTGKVLFPEAIISDTTTSGINRAKLSWYFMDRALVDPSSGRIPDFVKNDSAQHYIRPFQLQDIYPNKTYSALSNYSTTFDISYYPTERGPYNLDATNINEDGTLKNPETRWGGLMRSIENTDFEQSNIEYIEFWMLDPYIGRPGNSGGDLYINLGNVSEDILKDGVKSFENGLPYPFNEASVVRTHWGYAPSFQQQLTRAFDNNPDARALQDVGYDGLTDEQEREKFSGYLQQILNTYGPNSYAYQKAFNDPAGDNYKFYNDPEYEQAGTSVITRYKHINSPHGNSPIVSENQASITSVTQVPEAEDINRDNTLNQSEEYYQYRVRIEPFMEVGKNFIVSKQTPTVKLLNGNTATETWYQFKIPITEFQNKVGGISDFRSIRFIRMFATGFTDSVIMRFAKLEFGRNNWRRYLLSLKNPGENIPPDEQLATTFEINSVSLEENSGRLPIPYVMPPGVQRQQQVLSNNQTALQNEQSLSLRVCGLKDGDARGAYKETAVDMRQFKRLRMFIHAESQLNENPARDGDVRAFVRIGSDFINNYYEYQVPLKLTPHGSTDDQSIWPESNKLDLLLDDLVRVKTLRDESGAPVYIPYETKDEKGNIIRVVGSPNIGEGKTMMLGVMNPKKTRDNNLDDGMDKCVEVWFDELRAVGMNEKPGYAATGRINAQLADLGSIRAGGTMHTIGYGNLDQKINQRFRDNFTQYDVSTNLNLGKLMPKNWGVQLPLFYGYNQSASNPEYDPYDLDIKLKDKLTEYDGRARDSVRKAAQDFRSISSFNFNSVRFMGNPEKQKKPMPWSLRNFDFTYSFNRTLRHNPLLEKDELTTTKYGLGYTYAVKTKPFEPFKKSIKSKSKWLGLIKDFNINYLPSNFSFRTEMNRTFNETIIRDIDNGGYRIEPTYFKNFFWTRDYSIRWDLTKSLSFDYHALNTSRIDEPYGRIDNPEKRDTLWNRIGQFGRNTNYAQQFNASYNLPTTKIPLLDWTTFRTQYSATYDWLAASLLAKNLGNTISNTQSIQINGDFNFIQLYNKNRYLKAIASNSPVNKAQLDPRGGKEIKGKEVTDGLKKDAVEAKPEPEKPKEQPPKVSAKEELRKKLAAVMPTPIDLTGKTDHEVDSIRKVQLKEVEAKKKALIAQAKKDKKAERAARRAKTPQIHPIAKFFGKMVLMVKRISFNYTENSGSMLPGYMDSTTNFGVNLRNGYSDLGFVMGYQPDRQWLNRNGEVGMFTRDSLFNTMLNQNFQQNLNVTSTIEPITDFRVDLTMTKTFSKTQSALFKDVNNNGEFDFLNPLGSGTFNVTNIGLKTMFQDVNIGSGVYNQFSENREVVSGRLGETNPYSRGIKDPNDPRYSKGYTQYSQDVLIPSFLAALNGKSANEIGLLEYDNNKLKSNPFKNYSPLPNWRVTYNGLSKLPFLKPILQNMVINHSYTGTISMNNYSTALNYMDIFGLAAPSFIDSNSGNFVPFYQVPNITQSDQLNPLLGFEATFTNKLTASFQYRKTRTASISLVDYQISVVKSSEFIIGLGYRVKGVTLPFEIFGLRYLKNDLTFKFDFSIRDDESVSNMMAMNEKRITMGNKVIGLNPTIDYIINDNLSIRFYVDRRSTSPKIAPPYPTSNTRGGITLRYTFTQ